MKKVFILVLLLLLGACTHTDNMWRDPLNRESTEPVEFKVNGCGKKILVCVKVTTEVLTSEKKKAAS